MSSVVPHRRHSQTVVWRREPIFIIRQRTNLIDDGFTHREVVEEVDVVGSNGAFSNILNRRKKYEQQMIEHGYSYPDLESTSI